MHAARQAQLLAPGGGGGLDGAHLQELLQTPDTQAAGAATCIKGSLHVMGATAVMGAHSIKIELTSPESRTDGIE